MSGHAELYELVKQLSEKKIRIWLENDALKFKAPKGALDAELKNRMIQLKQELIEFLKEKEQGGKQIQARQDKESFPLSNAQKRLWFIDQFSEEKQKSAYNIPVALKLNGQLNIEALEQAINKLVQKHEVLQTRFVNRNGLPVQERNPVLEIKLVQHDISHLSDDEKSQVKEELVEENLSTNFSLDCWPLFRPELIKLDDGQYIFLATMHHIISDGWSMNVVVSELANFYQAFLESGDIESVPLEIDYADYAQWQNENIEAQEKQLAFWKEYLHENEILELPLDKKRFKDSGQPGSHVRGLIEKAQYQQLQALANKQGVTLYMLLLSAFNILLHRFSQQEDISVGIPVAGRPRPELEKLIGFFVNTLVLRTRLESQTPFNQLLRQVQADTLAIFSNQDVPFDKVIESLVDQRDTGYTPLFQVMFSLQGAGSENALSLPGLEIEKLDNSIPQSRYDMTWNLEETEEGIALDIEYRTDLFLESTIKAYLEYFNFLLNQICENPDSRISEYKLQAPEQTLTQQLAFNPEARDYPSSQLLFPLFETIAKKQGNAIAVSGEAAFCEGLTHNRKIGKGEAYKVSYHELLEDSYSVSGHLARLGVSENDRVLIALPRSLEMIQGLLGILRLGACYVPLDPDYPDERKNYIRDDSQASLLITSRQLVDKLAVFNDSNIKLLFIEELLVEGEEKGKASTYQSEKSADTAAAILYTSGSTGQPKGVIVPHRAIARLVCNNEFYVFTEHDVLGHISNVCFDASNMEIWGALLNGGRLHVIDQDDLLSVRRFGEILAEQSVSAMFISGGLFRLYAQESPEIFSPLKNLLVGGEILDLNAVRSVLECASPPSQLSNGYGPTENTTFTAVHAIDEIRDDLISVPLGKSISNSRVFIVDDDGNLLPPGLEGELVCAGDGLALGYLNQETLSNEKFRTGFIRALPNERVYLSGDIARYSQDGLVILTGRKDEQVKLRGFRIEPGEIQSVIEEVPFVQGAVVVVKQNPGGEKYLVAYLVFEQEQKGNSKVIEQVREIVQQKLPAFMRPSFYVEISAIPVNANGKLDKPALPDPDWSTLAVGDYVEPNTALQKKLVEIWCELLSLDNIGIRSNFFELGGHSLLATRLASRIQEAFSINLSVKQIFENPDIEQLASYVANHGAGGVNQTVEISRVSRESSHPLSRAQQRLWFMHQMNPESTAYGMPMAVSIKGKLDKQKLESALEALVERHESLRTRFVLEGEQVRQKIIPVQGAYSYDYRKPGNEQEVKQAVSNNEQRSFDLENGPLFYVDLLETGTDEYLLLMNMHHIISDGWSMQILHQDLAALYVDKDGLPELEVQYLDFACWQNDYLDQEKTGQLIDYWKEELKGVAEVLHLPTDRPRPEQQSFNGGLYKHELDADLQERLINFCKENEFSSFVFGISAFALLLSKYSQQDDFCIGIPVSGRNHHKIENLIGFFINGIVLRSDLKNRLTVMELLEQFREKSLEGFRHQDLSADLLIEALGIRPDPRYQPLAQVAFSHQSFDEASSIDLEGIEFKILESENHSAKYDLMLNLADDGKKLELACEYASDLFDSSTIASLMQHYESLLDQMLSSPEKQCELLAWYSNDQILETIKAGNEKSYTDFYPLSLNQKAIYLDALINPETRQNSIANFLEISGEIDEKLWQKAFVLIQEQHDVFRTDIVNVDLPGYHKVCQAVRKTVDEAGTFSFQDLSDRQLDFESAVKFLEAEAYCQYDVEKDDLYHYSLNKLADGHYLAMLRAHHIIFDGVAGKVFLDEICSVYEALSEKREPEFHDDKFALFVNEALQKNDEKACIQFWQKRTANIESLDFNGGKNPEAGFQQKSITFDTDLSKQLRQYCRSRGITPALFFKCIYALLVREYCRPESDYYLLEYAHGRSKAFENSYGVFYQQTPFVVDKDIFEASTSYEELLEAMLAYARQFQRDVKSFRDFSVQAQRQMLPFSNIGFMYNFTQFESGTMLNGVSQKSVFLSPRAEGQVQLFVRDRQSEYELLLLFGSDYFNDLNLLERFKHFVHSLLCDDKSIEADFLLDQDISALKLLNNDFVSRDYDKSFLLTEFIRCAGADSAKAPALIVADEKNTELSHQELNSQSDGLASYLRKRFEIGQGSQVAVYCEDPKNFYVSMFALLKTGASYVPVSPKLPCERVHHIVENGQIQIVLCDDKLFENLSESHVNAHTVEQLVSEAEKTTQPAENISSPDINDCIYSIFTSGSTGVPKGAMVSHKGENNLLSWYEKTLGISEEDSTIIISDVGFDLTQKNFFAFLRHGGSVLFPELELFDPELVRKLIEKYQVSHINCAPSAFYALLDGKESAWKQLASLRWVVLGGEAILLSELAEWMQSEHCHARVMNSYGPTECSDVVCACEISPEMLANLETPPLGRAIDNAELYVVNDMNRCVPVGLSGELAIGGECLGLGYIEQAKLNEEKFISIDTPFGEKQVYLSGDLGLVNDNGMLEYIGRKDFQIKLRGQRIELAEIEHALRALESVRDALVLLSKETLIAYVVTEEVFTEKDFDDQQALKTLSKSLPLYMLPSQIIALESWPLNTNGKIDRKALPEPTPASEKERIEPKTDTEKALAEIWSEILSLPEVGTNESFFELGGHSLLATRAVSRLKEHFQVEFPLKALFDLHTIAEIAEYVDSLLWALDSQERKSEGSEGDEESREEGFL